MYNFFSRAVPDRQRLTWHCTSCRSEFFFNNLYFKVQGQTFEEALEAQRNKLKEKDKKKEKKKESPLDKKKRPKKGKDARDTKHDASVSNLSATGNIHKQEVGCESII